MKKILYYLILSAILIFTVSCSKDNLTYISKQDALSHNFVVIDGAQSDNKDIFYSFLNKVENRKTANIDVAIYDLINDSYITSVHYDGKSFIASGYFINTKSKVSKKFNDLTYTDLIQTSSKNYFLRDSSGNNEDIWIFQGE